MAELKKGFLSGKRGKKGTNKALAILENRTYYEKEGASKKVCEAARREGEKSMRKERERE